jgi:hypothetical protein
MLDTIIDGAYTGKENLKLTSESKDKGTTSAAQHEDNLITTRC